MRDEKYRISCFRMYSVLLLHVKCQFKQMECIFVWEIKALFLILQLIYMYMSMFSAIASFPFLHKLGRVMGKKSIWIHVSLLLQ